MPGRMDLTAEGIGALPGTRGGEGGGGVARGGEHQDRRIVREAAQDHAGFQVLERAGRQQRAALGPVAAEGDPQIRQPESTAEFLGPAGDRPGGAGYRTDHRQPGETEDAAGRRRVLRVQT